MTPRAGGGTCVLPCFWGSLCCKVKRRSCPQNIVNFSFPGSCTCFQIWRAAIRAERGQCQCNRKVKAREKKIRCPKMGKETEIIHKIVETFALWGLRDVVCSWRGECLPGGTRWVGDPTWVNKYSQNKLGTKATETFVFKRPHSPHSGLVRRFQWRLWWIKNKGISPPLSGNNSCLQNLDVTPGKGRGASQNDGNLLSLQPHRL